MSHLYHSLISRPQQHRPLLHAGLPRPHNDSQRNIVHATAPSRCCNAVRRKRVLRLQIFYRRHAQATVHQFRFIADFACSLVEVLALAREFDLISSWNWTVPDSRILSERSDMDLSAFAVVRMPWPFNNRYATVRAQGGDCLQEDACARVVFASCPCVRAPPPRTHPACQLPRPACCACCAMSVLAYERALSPRPGTVELR